MAMKLPKADLDQAYKGAWYTVAGAGGDLREWVDGMTNLLEKEGIGRPAEWYVSKGTDVNRKFKLKGENRFFHGRNIYVYVVNNHYVILNEDEHEYLNGVSRYVDTYTYDDLKDYSVYLDINKDDKVIEDGEIYYRTTRNLIRK